MIVGFLVVAVTSAILGGIIALALFKPDPEVVVREVLVEPSEPLLRPSPPDFDRLVERYIEIAGTEDEWTASLIDEIAPSVCNDGHSGAQIMEDLGRDIDLDQDQLDAFVEEVRVTCPERS